MISEGAWPAAAVVRPVRPVHLGTVRFGPNFVGPKAAQTSRFMRFTLHTRSGNHDYKPSVRNARIIHRVRDLTQLILGQPTENVDIQRGAAEGKFALSPPLLNAASGINTESAMM